MFDIEKEREAFEKALEQSQGFEFKYLIGITFNNDLNKYEASGAHWCDEVIEACKEINIGWTSWQLAKAHEAKKLEGCVEAPVWISVDFLLPDLDSKVLICIANEVISAEYTILGFVDSVEKAMLHQDLITHWMTQPEPPEAARGGNHD